MVANRAIGMGLIDLDLTDLDIDRISKNTDNVRSIAQAVCEKFAKPDRKNKHDHAADDYGEEICRLLADIVGEKITYATRLDARQSAERKYGPHLAVVLAALRLIDPGSTVDQARRLIDRYRGWI